ncbi:MAG: M20 family metallopeptidase [Ferroplasma sp.]|uniref:M20 family metallopeptidase n=1 Tax=Ferroplasma sp. TaxID=2591003 RepID=UPI002814AB97|nr:M20 family metallopeptidase [Ferroplasma sp.]WMT52039.1 MAG: M20 family metallopeptidase [Ferroplasma sp.]
MDNVIEYFEKQKDDIISDLKSIIEIESPSTDKESLDAFASFMKGYIKQQLGLDAELLDSPDAGKGLRLRIKGKLEKQVLLLCHYDTVFSKGTIKNRPFRIADGKAYGPGVFDMKTGIVQTIYALKALIKNNELLHTVVLLITSDEEIESKSSKDNIIGEAKKSLYTLVMEPSLNGALKTERSGVGTITVKVYGKASHAGLDPESGANAIYELAYMIPEIIKLNDKNMGTSLNLDVISGGDRSNVIPDFCQGIMDIRYRIPEESDRVIRELKDMPVKIQGTKREIEYTLRPPMIKTAESEELYERIKKLGAENGINISQASVAGGSDGNFCSYYCPVIDGLGAVGDGAHSENEYVFIDKIPERTALLYLILKNIN